VTARRAAGERASSVLPPRVGRLAVAFCFATLVGLALAACGPASGDARPAASPVATSSVDLPPSYRFSPAAITVDSGTTVTWSNHDNFTHSVQFLDGGLPTDARLMKPGESTTYTFTAPGAYRYQCSLHPQAMQGSVVVLAP
jgi:plastocyanin